MLFPSLAGFMLKTRKEVSFGKPTLVYPCSCNY